jgi:FixJ family two-component response regulator
MENEPKLTIWVVDEIDADLQTTVTALKRHLKNKAQIDVVGLSAITRPKKEDYLSIVSNPRTAALILDQRLKTRGSVDHTGIELALFLRNVSPNIPIYIMTGYTTENGEPNDEFNGTDWSVEDILDKSILSKKSEMNRFVERLLRRINVHVTITEEREKMFQTLLLRSMEAELTPEEQEEFDRISFERLGALALSDQLQQRQMEDALNRLEKAIAFFDEQNKTE